MSGGTDTTTDTGTDIDTSIDICIDTDTDAEIIYSLFHETRLISVCSTGAAYRSATPHRQMSQDLSRLSVRTPPPPPSHPHRPVDHGPAPDMLWNRLLAT